MQISHHRNKLCEFYPAPNFAKLYAVVENDKDFSNGWVQSFWSTKAEAIKEAKKLTFSSVQRWLWSAQDDEYILDLDYLIFMKTK